MTDRLSQVVVTRIREGQRSSAPDLVAAEVPLELRVDGRAFAVIMRTPGDDRSLAAGFLLSERLIRRVDDVAVIEHCTDPGLERRGRGDGDPRVRAIERRFRATAAQSRQ